MVNNLGVDPDEWFSRPNPLDSMPLATNNGRTFDWEDTAPSEYEPDIVTNKYAPPERRAELESNPRPEEEIADWFIEKPDDSDEIEKEKTMHQKMYEMATQQHSPWKGGGSENFQGGSEKIQT